MSRYAIYYIYSIRKAEKSHLKNIRIEKKTNLNEFNSPTLCVRNTYQLLFIIYGFVYRDSTCQ